jgi:beta-glucanase (GH16 family)
MKFLFKNTYILALLAISFWNCEYSEMQTVTTMENLVVQDEFDGTELNASFWNYEIGTGQNGWGNNELQYYTNRPQNITIEGGMLKITALQESYEGSGYTSARINTKGLFSQKQGRFEARIKMPWGQGLWPAFWLLGENYEMVGWPNCGEIDIMEYRGQAPTIVAGSVHGPGYSGGEAVSKEYELTNDRFDTGFHIFGIEWGENYINYYVDNVLYNQITPEDVSGTWVFDQPFFIILNLAVGGNYVGSPHENTVFPQTMYIDYIRVYQ